MANIGNAGALIRRESTARTTGGVVQILNLAHEDAPTSGLFTAETIAEAIESGETWGTACQHEAMATWTTVREASAKAANPEMWCAECELLAEGRGYFTDGATS